MFHGSAVAMAADAAVEELQERIASGNLESWLESSLGRMLAVMTNAERAMVMLLNDESDPGEHATDAGAEG